jgi:hypothetical protein
MENNDWKILFDYAMRQLHSANIPNEAWILGGGTVLMFNFNHRYSKDIDIFFSDPQYLSFVSPRINDCVEDKLNDFIEQAHFTKLFFSEGDVDFILGRQISSFPPREIVQLPGVMTEHPVEIITKKIFYRADSFKPRDIFDLATVYRHCRKEMIKEALLFTNMIDTLQSRIQSLYRSGRLEAELNDMNLEQKNSLTANQSFVICKTFLDTIRKIVHQHENNTPSLSM